MVGLGVGQVGLLVGHGVGIVLVLVGISVGRGVGIGPPPKGGRVVVVV